MKQIAIVAIAIAVIGASVPGAVRAQIAPPVQDVFTDINGTATQLTRALLTFDAAGTSFVTGSQGLVHCVTATVGAWSRAVGQQVPSLRAASTGCTPARSIAASIGTVNGFPSTAGGSTGSTGDGSAGSSKITGNGAGNGGSGVNVSPSSNDVFNTGGTTGSGGSSTGGNGGPGSTTASASTPSGDPGNNDGAGPGTGGNSGGTAGGQTQDQSGSGNSGSGGYTGSTGNISTGGAGSTSGSGSGVQGNGSHGNGADSHGVDHGKGAGLEGDKVDIGHKEKAK